MDDIDVMEQFNAVAYFCDSKLIDPGFSWTFNERGQVLVWNCVEENEKTETPIFAAGVLGWKYKTSVKHTFKASHLIYGDNSSSFGPCLELTTDNEDFATVFVQVDMMVVVEDNQNQNYNSSEAVVQQLAVVDTRKGTSVKKQKSRAGELLFFCRQE